VQHADLNANNIMLDGRGGAWLLDFDRGRLRKPGPWREKTLARLGRSLAKIASAAALGDEWRARFEVLKRAHDAARGG
jgi:3-deoxy-D-manno-octulosonic acid kinase